ncbi:hypothetical protein INR49_017472 [Caranx melampygus]|nr:hypothetical protein INR49_017472 [Caranx melampygus]
MSKKRCCTVDGCKEANVSLHTLPKDRSVRDQWLKFIFYRIPQDFSPYLLVCSAHFTADSFTNLAQYNAGFAKKLRTKDTAVPTLFGPTSTQQPGTSQHSVKFKHVGTQTDPPRRSTVGTQLSIGTLKGHNQLLL